MADRIGIRRDYLVMGMSTEEIANKYGYTVRYIREILQEEKQKWKLWRKRKKINEKYGSN